MVHVFLGILVRVGSVTAKKEAWQPPMIRCSAFEGTMCVRDRSDFDREKMCVVIVNCPDGLNCSGSYVGLYHWYQRLVWHLQPVYRNRREHVAVP